ncbi:Hypothetical_protein [Hexamita inflata]|uniref:Hypothetical_protein n=1 Tax=Hexamita inflata TaxID=28002 RepID=A0AA86RPG5_9EUKA|nr:Hypothetical protein HINF_LOCUS63277 [Hexamita inflata]
MLYPYAVSPPYMKEQIKNKINNFITRQDKINLELQRQIVKKQFEKPSISPKPVVPAQQQEFKPHFEMQPNFQTTRQTINPNYTLSVSDESTAKPTHPVFNKNPVILPSESPKQQLAPAQPAVVLQNSVNFHRNIDVDQVPFYIPLHDLEVLNQKNTDLEVLRVQLNEQKQRQQREFDLKLYEQKQHFISPKQKMEQIVKEMELEDQVVEEEEEEEIEDEGIEIDAEEFDPEQELKEIDTIQREADEAEELELEITNQQKILQQLLKEQQDRIKKLKQLKTK